MANGDIPTVVEGLGLRELDDAVLAVSPRKVVVSQSPASNALAEDSLANPTDADLRRVANPSTLGVLAVRGSAGLVPRA